MEWLNNISEDIIPNNITNKEEKLEVARKVAEKVKDGDVIGFVSGSTSNLAAIEIANKIEKENYVVLGDAYEEYLITELERLPENINVVKIKIEIGREYKK